MAIFPIPRIVVFRMYMKEAMVDDISTNESIVDDIPVDNKDNFEGERV